LRQDGGGSKKAADTNIGYEIAERVDPHGGAAEKNSPSMSRRENKFRPTSQIRETAPRKEETKEVELRHRAHRHTLLLSVQLR